MRESTLRLLNYGAILAILLTLAAHFATQSFVGVRNHAEALTYTSILARYDDVAWRAALGLLLVAATFHGLLGLRNMLMEVRSTPRWRRAVTVAVFVIGGIMIGWGLRTLVVTQGA